MADPMMTNAFSSTTSKPQTLVELPVEEHPEEEVTLSVAVSDEQLKNACLEGKQVMHWLDEQLAYLKSLLDPAPVQASTWVLHFLLYYPIEEKTVKQATEDLLHELCAIPTLEAACIGGIVKTVELILAEKQQNPQRAEGISLFFLENAFTFLDLEQKVSRMEVNQKSTFVGAIERVCQPSPDNEVDLNSLDEPIAYILEFIKSTADFYSDRPQKLALLLQLEALKQQFTLTPNSSREIAPPGDLVIFLRDIIFKGEKDSDEQLQNLYLQLRTINPSDSSEASSHLLLRQAYQDLFALLYSGSGNHSLLSPVAERLGQLAVFQLMVDYLHYPKLEDKENEALPVRQPSNSLDQVNEPSTEVPVSFSLDAQDFSTLTDQAIKAYITTQLWQRKGSSLAKLIRRPTPKASTEEVYQILSSRLLKVVKPAHIPPQAESRIQTSLLSEKLTSLLRKITLLEKTNLTFSDHHQLLACLVEAIDHSLASEYTWEINNPQTWRLPQALFDMPPDTVRILEDQLRQELGKLLEKRKHKKAAQICSRLDIMLQQFHDLQLAGKLTPFTDPHVFLRSRDTQQRPNSSIAYLFALSESHFPKLGKFKAWLRNSRQKSRKPKDNTQDWKLPPGNSWVRLERGLNKALGYPNHGPLYRFFYGLYLIFAAPFIWLSNKEWKKKAPTPVETGAPTPIPFQLPVSNRVEQTEPTFNEGKSEEGKDSDRVDDRSQPESDHEADRQSLQGEYAMPPTAETPPGNPVQQSELEVPVPPAAADDLSHPEPEHEPDTQSLEEGHAMPPPAEAPPSTPVIRQRSDSVTPMSQAVAIDTFGARSTSPPADQPPKADDALPPATPNPSVSEQVPASNGSANPESFSQTIRDPKTGASITPV